jgi:hypothetical protein
MSWNLENFFDTADDPANPYDNTYRPLADKNNDPQHAANCDTLYSDDTQAKCRAVRDPATPSYKLECKTLDWTQKKFDAKIQAVASVLRDIAPPPDVIILPELENRAVLEALNDQVKALGYFTVVELDSTVTDCDRGIDVGVLTRLQLAGSPSTHRIDFGDDRALCGATRDITQVPLELPGGKTLILFAVHFPRETRPFAAITRCRN